MTCFSWLHLTDLHCGNKAQDCLYPDEEEIFFEDLKKLHEKCGPWDLVLFTGDLTCRGSEEEFKRLDDFFNQLWEKLKTLGSNPKLLAVPGNHDLARPAPKDPSARLLQQWNEQPDIQTEFWEDADSPYRLVVTRAFANYTNWWKDHRFRAKDINDGILPGDFAATIEKSGAKLGVLGLNNAFLQLTGHDYQGRLALHSRQFQDACGGNGIKWTQQHHACLLLTHHSPDWLNLGALQCLNGEITARGRFAVHLCGHLHEETAGYEVVAKGGTEARRIWQGRSLFGTEFFGKNSRERRDSYGYTAGKIELGEGKGVPRESKNIHKAKQVPDLNQKKKRDLVNLLLECPSTQDGESIRALTRELPPHIANAIKMGNTPQVHALNIVNACRVHEEGLECLLEVVEFFDGETNPFRKLRVFINELANTGSADSHKVENQGQKILKFWPREVVCSQESSKKLESDSSLKLTNNEHTLPQFIGGHNP